MNEINEMYTASRVDGVVAASDILHSERRMQRSASAEKVCWVDAQGKRRTRGGGICHNVQVFGLRQIAAAGTDFAADRH